jgi:hypothetical protein
MEYARQILSKIYPNGYKIDNIRSYIPDRVSDSQIELNEKHINRIFANLSQISNNK